MFLLLHFFNIWPWFNSNFNINRNTFIIVTVNQPIGYDVFHIGINSTWQFDFIAQSDII